jgi:hypothetical protein
MANIASSNVTYSTPLDSVDRRLEGLPPHYEAKVRISFGNGVLTYPTNGVPLDPGKLGMPAQQLEGILIYDQAASVAAGVEWFFDSTHNSLRGFSAIGTELTGGVTAPAATAIVVLARGY